MSTITAQPVARRLVAPSTRSVVPAYRAATSSAELTEDRRTAAHRTLDVLGAFDGARTVLGVSEIAAQAGVPKSTAHRLLAVLIQKGYVKREGERYRLAERVFELGARAAGPSRLHETMIPFMTELHHLTRETVHLAILDDNTVLYLEKLYGHGASPCPTRVGGRHPVHCTALGKALLSRSESEAVQCALSGRLARPTMRSLYVPEAILHSVDQVRETGYAVDSEECHVGLSCVAAPIVDKAGRAVAAVSISGPTTRFQERKFARGLLQVTEHLSGRSA